jgi:hypothetical protein
VNSHEETKSVESPRSAFRIGDGDAGRHDNHVSQPRGGRPLLLGDGLHDYAADRMLGGLQAVSETAIGRLLTFSVRKYFDNLGAPDISSGRPAILGNGSI